MFIYQILITEDSDYNKTTLSSVISGTNTISVSVPITDDEYSEGDETFFASLIAGLIFPDSVTLDPSNADAIITDDDGK